MGGSISQNDQRGYTPMYYPTKKLTYTTVVTIYQKSSFKLILIFCPEGSVRILSSIQISKTSQETCKIMLHCFHLSSAHPNIHYKSSRSITEFRCNSVGDGSTRWFHILPFQKKKRKKRPACPQLWTKYLHPSIYIVSLTITIIINM